MFLDFTDQNVKKKSPPKSFLFILYIFHNFLFVSCFHFGLMVFQNRHKYDKNTRQGIGMVDLA